MTAPTLTVVAGPDLGRSFPLAGGGVTAGRAAANPLHLNDPTVSRVHCEFAPAPGGWLVRDRGSGNGTRVNGQPVTEVELKPGDRVAVGDTVLEYAAGPPRASVTDAPSEVLRTVAADAGSRLLADAAGPAWVRTRLTALTVLYQAADAVSAVGDTDALLGRVLELLLPAAAADHGCVLLGEPDGLRPAAARGRDGSREVAVSRTVAEQVLASGEGLLVADTAADERFADGASVARHGLRQMVCVPLAGRRGVVGVLFLGGRRAGGFTDDHLQLAAAVGHLAAVAVEEARAVRGRVQAERLAAVGQTMAATGHHIKNVMQGVRTGGDVVRLGLADGDLDAVRRGWKLVERNQARIDSLMLDLLGYAKEREPGREPTDLRALAADVLDTVRGPATDRGVSLMLEPGDPVTVPADPDGLHRALLNVVGNAVDAAGDGGAVTLTVWVRGENAEVVVADTGGGVPADQCEAVFEPFVSGKGGRGTGLGLPVARKTLREHGGDVAAVPGPGGRFVLTLPR